MSRYAKPTRYGAVAVVYQQGRLLVIRRSQHVEAPGTYCFPGGAIEEGESPQDAVRRELYEELSVRGHPQRQLWTSVTSWNVALSWWYTQLSETDQLRPDPAEVSETLWVTPEQMRLLPSLLESNRQFLDAWDQGVFDL